MKKILEGLAESDLITPTHSVGWLRAYWSPKKDGTYRLVVEYLGLNGQREKICLRLPGSNDLIDFLE